MVAIDGKDLTVDVNSLKRARKIHQQIKRHLGQDAVFKGAVSQSAEQVLRHRAALPDDVRQSRALLLADGRDLSPPQAKRHADWEAWLDQEIWSLGDESPREAARTRKGRERLEVLFLEYEGRSDNMNPDLRPNIPALRKKQGI